VLLLCIILEEQFGGLAASSRHFHRTLHTQPRSPAEKMAGAVASKGQDPWSSACRIGRRYVTPAQNFSLNVLHASAAETAQQVQRLNVCWCVCVLCVCVCASSRARSAMVMGKENTYMSGSCLERLAKECTHRMLWDLLAELTRPTKEKPQPPSAA
jgi:hypothetical protein